MTLDPSRYHGADPLPEAPVSRTPGWDDLRGQTMGKLTVVGWLGKAKRKKGRWCVRCDCGMHEVRTTPALKTTDIMQLQCRACESVERSERAAIAGVENPMSRRTVEEIKSHKAKIARQKRLSFIETNRDLIYQFVIGLSEIDLSPPPGMPAAEYNARRLKDIRTAARQYVHTIGQMQEAGS